MTDTFASSDAVRSAQPLRHARSVTFAGPITLEQGGTLPEVTVCYETWGELAPDRGNAVLVCHALSGDSHAARHDAADDPGWWDLLIGPGLAIDTRRLFVVCANVLGGCRGTTGPASIDPASGRPWAGTFPTVTMGDMVEVQRMLADHLGLDRLLAVVGGSMGGMQAMAWAVRHPRRVGGVAVLAAAPRLGSQALAFDVVARNAILQDPGYRGGEYYGSNGPESGLAIARMLGHITYLSREAMAAKFEADRHRPRPLDTPFEARFSVGSYLAYQGGRFVERFDANSYLRISLAVDLFDLGADQAALAAALAPSACPWLVVSFSSDWLFPPEQSRDLVKALVAGGKPVSYADIPTRAGHDAFLLPDEVAIYGGLVASFLQRCAGAGPAVALPAEPLPPSDPRPATSIFAAPRLDLDRIAELIPPEASVLDLGCGGGALLARLKGRGQRRLVGVERDLAAITRAMARGLDVVHADLNLGLEQFEQDQFDVVVLSQTLPSVVDVERLLRELVRVGRRGIVTFPNLGHWRHRESLASEGRVPVLGAARGWWDSPVVRPFSIADFEDCCRALALTVHDRHWLDLARGLPVRDDPNRQADLALFVIGR